MRLLVLILTALLLSSTAAAAVCDNKQVATAAVSPLHYECCARARQYAPNSPYHRNLRLLPDKLLANVRPNSSNPSPIFAYGSIGDEPDSTVYGFVLCRGDYPGNPCAEGLKTAFADAVDKGFVCPSYRDVTIYYDQYMLAFSGDDLQQNHTNGQEWVASNMNNVTGEAGVAYGKSVEKLMNATADFAAWNSSERYATGKAWVQGTNVSMVYGLVQCRRDLEPDDCRSCLAELVKLMPEWFTDKYTGGRGDHRVGGRIIGLRCNLRFEKELFFQETTATRELDKPPNKGDDRNNTVTIILSSVAGVLFLIIVLFGLFLLRWIIKQKRESQTQSELEEWTKLLAEEIGTMFSLFTFSEIRNATDNFSEAKRLGEGAFGPVYQGQLSCGVAAIKRLAAYSRQGLAEFRNEIRLIAKLQHLNLVKLIGCCMQHNEKILVYEYMPNKSLDDIFSDVAKWASLTWSIRQNIIDGIAQGLLYIHNYSQPETCIVHRDLKASNILLDSQMNPKISDFGIARIFSSSVTVSRTTKLMGTRGYMAPEYFFENTFSTKSDVFSFGVLVLEMISGRKVATSFRRYKGSKNLLAYAWRLWEDGNCKQLIDNSLIVEEHSQEAVIIRCIQIALLCVQANPEDRPDMRDVVRMLSNKDTQLDNPKQPSYFNESIVNTEVAASNNHTHTQYHTAVHVHPA
ncbi:hypothetical protein ACP70R_046565 [Stipagrostis hirtigluma subsp. patula]